MSVQQQQPVPVREVLDTVLKAEQGAARFYEAGAETTRLPEVAVLFTRLTSETKRAATTFGTVCEKLKRDESRLEETGPVDLHLLASLARSAFDERAAEPEQRVQTASAARLLEDGLKLERDLLLCHTTLYRLSRTEHRPVFSELLERGERHIAELSELRRRISQA